MDCHLHRDRSNAGIDPHLGSDEEMSDERWDDILFNRWATCFHVIREVVPYMTRQTFGSILATSSVSGKIPMSVKILCTCTSRTFA
ncbi:SDR family NAD(P)-dependent oxidoreductase [Alicyclobacillus macrosporangiidus]|uniref:SDR family NAD(P)-dependent oxidoreductase n=1 Tax=Alicyclobacillus macrosporangiidus TaxID=392015 RepID=UPI0018CC61E8